MLDLMPGTSEATSPTMPIDFTPYLLSASPPTAGFELLGYAYSQQQHHRPQFNISSSAICQQQTCNSGSVDSSNINKLNSLSSRRNKPLKSIMLNLDSASNSDMSGDSGSESQPESPHSPGRLQKKVSFADHKGMALATVRIMTERSDEPPRLKPELLSSVTQGACAGVTDKPPIKLRFKQPASDYLAFREKIDKQLVSLENVIIRDYSIVGTIKVKNIVFEKHVFVRYTCDSWASYEDSAATFVPGPSYYESNPFDTFTFTIEVPPKFDISKKIEICVCFEENRHQHWDNNNGANYVLVSEHYEDPSVHRSIISGVNSAFLPMKRTDEWTEYSSWRDMDTTTPYY